MTTLEDQLKAARDKASVEYDPGDPPKEHLRVWSGTQVLRVFKFAWDAGAAKATELLAQPVGKEHEGFDHPCKQTCSGWQQGFDKARAQAAKEIETLRKELRCARDMQKEYKEDAESRRIGRDNLDQALTAERARSARLLEVLEFYSWDGQVKPDDGKKADAAIAEYGKGK